MVATHRQPRRTPRSVTKTGKVARWGNSLGFRIPLVAVQQLQLKAGTLINLEVSQDSIILRPERRPRRKWTEAELLAGITPDVCGPELIPDRVGKEIL